MKRERTIDAYIEPIKVNNITEEHKMYIHYAGVEGCFLHQHPEIADFAAYFKRKLSCSNTGMLFTDSYGMRKNEEDFDSILYVIDGLDNIDRALITLISTCTNLDIQSDLVVHIGDKSYPLVREVDGEEYLANDTFKLSRKGYSLDVLTKLSTDIEALKEKENDSIIEKRR